MEKYFFYSTIVAADLMSPKGNMVSWDLEILFFILVIILFENLIFKQWI